MVTAAFSLILQSLFCITSSRWENSNLSTNSKFGTNWFLDKIQSHPSHQPCLWSKIHWVGVRLHHFCPNKAVIRVASQEQCTNLWPNNSVIIIAILTHKVALIGEWLFSS